MKRIISLIEWGMAAALVWIMASSMVGIGLPEAYVNFQFSKPSAYRVLVPLLARVVMFALDLPSDYGVALVVFFSGIAAYWSMKKLFNYYRANRYAPFAFIFTYAMLTNHSYPIDFMTVFLFCLAFYLLASHKFGLYYTLFPFIVLHRETAVLLIILFAVYAYGQRSYFLALTYQIISFVLLRFALYNIFLDAPGVGNVEFLFLYDVTGTYLGSPLAWTVILILIIFGLVIASRWLMFDRPLKAMLLLFPIQVILHLLLGNPFEVRVMAESFPVFLLMSSMATASLFSHAPLLRKRMESFPNVFLMKKF